MVQISRIQILKWKVPEHFQEIDINLWSNRSHAYYEQVITILICVWISWISTVCMHVLCANVQKTRKNGYVNDKLFLKQHVKDLFTSFKLFLYFCADVWIQNELLKHFEKWLLEDYCFHNILYTQQLFIYRKQKALPRNAFVGPKTVVQPDMNCTSVRLFVRTYIHVHNISTFKTKGPSGKKISFLSFPLQHFRDNSILNCLVFRLTVAVIVCRMLRTNNVLCRMSGTKDETLVSRKPVSV